MTNPYKLREPRRAGAEDKMARFRYFSTKSPFNIKIIKSKRKHWITEDNNCKITKQKTCLKLEVLTRENGLENYRMPITPNNFRGEEWAKAPFSSTF